MKRFYLGIDVSKEKLDWCLMVDSKMVEELVVKNEIKSIQKAIFLLMDKHSIKPDDLLLCAEYTSQYTYPLCGVCEELGLDLWLENPAQIKYRSGLQRGKNDKLDAKKIAVYACKFIEKAKLFRLPEKVLEALKHLVSERDLYVVEKSKLAGQLTDQERFMDKTLFEKKKERLKSVLHQLEQSIADVDKEIKNLIQGDKTLSKQHELLCSVDGIGERTAIKMIIETNAFKDFHDPRKFCCHAGVAPFSFSSGSSLRSKNKVSQRADKSIKTLLHMAALSVATRMKGELHEYYLKKVSEG
ncbi:MAG: transposase, partial [Mediterranea sp.]|nr:transposase [Mediterranea sp.]